MAVKWCLGACFCHCVPSSTKLISPRPVIELCSCNVAFCTKKEGKSERIEWWNTFACDCCAYEYFYPLFLRYKYTNCILFVWICFRITKKWWWSCNYSVRCEKENLLTVCFCAVTFKFRLSLNRWWIERIY